ncbi:MAG: acyl-CoA dehydrogenase [Deltaproteobacteria bacterium]|nr:acyl-CoA dehydrogenase [Deltaproteobacteria bacterium]
MDFTFTQEQKIWQETVRNFVENELTPLAQKNDETQTFPMEVVPKMGELKMWGVFVPEKYGGAGGTNLDWVIMMEEIGRADASMGISVLGHCHTTRAILAMGSDTQKAKYLPPLAGSLKLAGFGLTEPDVGSDAAAITTRAARVNNSYVLNGTKAFISNAGVADVYVVFARTGRERTAKGISAFIVEADTAGFSVGKIENKMGIRSSMTGELVLDDCTVSTENLLGPENDGFPELMKVFGIERAGNSAISVGTAQAAMELAIEYTKQRPAFGKMVAEFQGVQWMIADMAIEIEAARLLVRQGAALADQGLPHSEKVAIAKVLSNEMSMRVTTNVVQLMGAAGYSKEYPAERYMRDAKMFAIGGGTTQIQRTIIARGLLR